MRRMLMMAAIFGSLAAPASAQESDPDLVRELDVRGEREDRSADLWYGTPGVRPGGDLLGPILELIRRPAGLLDFRPRTVPSYLPDRETAEAFRERR